MQQQEFNAPVEQFAANDIHNHHTHHWGESQPPDDPDMSLQCPQCQRLTWRYSRHCIHCQLDLADWRARHMRARLKRKLVRFVKTSRTLAWLRAG